MYQHKNHLDPESFSAKYNCTNLVYLEVFDKIIDAIATEKRIKKWNRDWKIRIIEERNPEWQDLSDGL